MGSGCQESTTQNFSNYCTSLCHYILHDFRPIPYRTSFSSGFPFVSKTPAAIKVVVLPEVEERTNVWTDVYTWIILFSFVAAMVRVAGSSSSWACMAWFN